MRPATMDEEFFPDDVIRSAKCRVRFSVPDLQRVHEVGGKFTAHQRRTGSRRRARIADHFERLIFDFDLCRRIFGQVTALRHDQSHGFANEGNLAGRQSMRPKSLPRFAALARLADHAAFCEHWFEIVQCQYRNNTGCCCRGR
jgi:hypothetical protein